MGRVGEAAYLVGLDGLALDGLAFDARVLLFLAVFPFAFTGLRAVFERAG